MPEPDEVTVAGTVVCVTPLNFIVIVEDGMKFEPVTVTVVPTGPEVGLREIEEVVTVKVAEPVLTPSVARDRLAASGRRG